MSPAAAAAGEHGIDDDTVVLEDDQEAEDSDAVLVDALEALRLAQPHMAQATGHHSDENQRPQTANGIRLDSEDSRGRANGVHSPEGKGAGQSKGISSSRRRHSNRLGPLAEGAMWGMFAKGNRLDAPATQDAAHDLSGSGTWRQSGLRSRLAEAAEDLGDVSAEDEPQTENTGFNSAQYWRTPLTIPDDIDNA